MAVLYVRSSDSNEEDIYVGTRPDLTAKNGWTIEPTGFLPFEAGEDTSRVFVLATKGGKIDVTFKPR